MVVYCRKLLSEHAHTAICFHRECAVRATVQFCSDVRGMRCLHQDIHDTVAGRHESRCVCVLKSLDEFDLGRFGCVQVVGGNVPVACCDLAPLTCNLGIAVRTACQLDKRMTGPVPLVGGAGGGGISLVAGSACVPGPYHPY